MTRTLSAHLEEWQYRAPIRIAGHTFLALKVLVVEIADAGYVGRGEAGGVFFLGDTPESCLEQLRARESDVVNGLDRMTLLETMASGGARNALDCALWDLECQLTGRSIWELTGIDPRPLMTLQTIGLEAQPEDVGRMALRLAEAPMLKLKLDADRPVERVQAARDARPDARIMVDVNQGFDLAMLLDVLPAFAELGVELVEQPLALDADHALEGLHSTIPFCADESCLHRGDLPQVMQRYQAINIKLDKTGGLTEALQLAEAAMAAGLKLMVGNMSGTSLAAAPAFVIAQLCDVVDLDGPYNLVSDRPHRLVYRDSIVSEPARRFWG